MEFYWYSGNFKQQFFVTLVIKIVRSNSNTKKLVEYESLGCLPSRKTLELWNFQRFLFTWEYQRIFIELFIIYYFYLIILLEFKEFLNK